MGPMVTLGGLVLPNAETYEQLYPVHVVRQEMRIDGGGPGKWRGGTGVDYEVNVLRSAEYSFRAEGLGRPTGIGVVGAGVGAASEVVFVRADGTLYRPPSFALVREGPGLLRIRSAGGGGFADPLTRPVADVVRDVRDEVVSVRAAADFYGVVMAGDKRHADDAATVARRRALRATRENPHPYPLPGGEGVNDPHPYPLPGGEGVNT
jgi:N-methylhydantoinase B